MNFTIKSIKATLSAAGMPIEALDGVAEEIAKRHMADIESIKEERDQYKASHEELPKVKDELAKLSDGDSFKAKYEAMKEKHDAYVAEIANKETMSKKQAAYKALLAECKISDKRHDAIAKLADLNAIELDEHGNIKDADKIKAALTTEWAEFVETTTTKTPTVPTPPASTTNPLDALKQQYNEAEKRGDVVGMQAALSQIKQIKKE